MLLRSFVHSKWIHSVWIYVFLWKLPQVENTGSKEEPTDAKAIAKIEADIEECKSEIMDMKSQISQLKNDISIKQSKLNDIETKEEYKVDIRNEKAELNKQLMLLMTSKAQLETTKTTWKLLSVFTSLQSLERMEIPSNKRVLDRAILIEG